MYVIRPVMPADLDPLLDLAHAAGFGLTTLPRDRALLERRIRQSLGSFTRPEDEPPHGESYLFVMEHTPSRRVVGTAGVVSKVGGFEPFYAYQIKSFVHESKMLKVRKEIQTLNLIREHNGPCEIGSLFLHPDARRDGNGRTLSLSRFLFMACFRKRFDPLVIAEMRGVIDEHGHCPFWDAVGKHFFDIEFPKADYLSLVNKQFIGELMPVHPIYLPLLPLEAQAVIGRTHDNTAPALKILQGEGFTTTDLVDIFEAGPIVQCELERIRTIRDSVCATVARLSDRPIASPRFVISNARMAFHACQGRLGYLGATEVALPPAVAEALNVAVGDKVCFATLRAQGG